MALGVPVITMTIYYLSDGNFFYGNSCASTNTVLGVRVWKKIKIFSFYAESNEFDDAHRC